MKRWVAGLLLALGASTIGAQTLQTYDFPVPLRCNFVPPTPQDACFLLSQAGGAYVKSVTPAGLATVQLANGTESTVQLTASGGGSFTRGTVDPTGGNAGDAYLQVDASDVVQSVWNNVAGTWTESTLPVATGTATNLAIANRDADSLEVTSSTGTDAEIPSATTALAGLQSSADKSKLDGIEANATADQTGAEIKAAYEGEADTNAFTDADETKLDGIAAGATVGITTFTGDNDTPNSYSGQARRLTRVNPAEAAIEFVDEPTNQNTIPHVGRLPTVTDSSPVLVFLTHDELGGDREDATFDVAQSGSQCGFSDGSIFNAFGAINKLSPIAMVFGVVDGGVCNLSTVHSFNEGFIDDIEFIAYRGTGTCQLGDAFQEFGATTKRILSCPDLQSVAFGDLALNFIYDDGTAYWTDGSVEHRAGLYEKVGTPSVYHDLAPPEDAHKTGEGSAACGDAEPPDAAGQICVTSDGRGYFAMPRTSLITTPASITVAAAAGDLFIADIYETDDLENRNGLTDGEFIYIKTTQEFYQYQDPDFEVVTWMEAWQYVIDNVGDTADRQAFLTSIFLGEFASESEVLRDRDGYTDSSVDYYFLYSDFGTLIEITAFTNSVRETISEGFAWRGPVIIPEEVLDVVSANPAGATNEALDSLLVGSRRYSVIVRPGANGELRATTAADYNAANSNSNVLGFDGLETRRAARRATSTATGTWTTVPSGTDITGTIFRWRGTHYQDYTLSGPVVLDVYHNRHTGCRRYFVGRWEACSYSTIFAGVGYLGEHFTTAQAATDHAAANGDYAIITENGVPHLQVLSDFVAAGTYDYYWSPTFTHQQIPDPVAIEYPFPAIANANDNLFYAHRTTDDHNYEVGFPARGTGDVWTMDVGTNVIAGEDNDQYGFVGGEGALTPTGSNIAFIYWRDSATESEQNIQVRFEDGGLIDNTLADGDIRIRFQRHHDVDQYANEDDWTTYELNRRTGGDNNHWETGNITDNPFDVNNRDFWIAFEYDDDGTWTRYAHGSITRFQRLLDDHDLADHDDDRPVATNTGQGSSVGNSGRLARANHRHDGPGYVHRRHNLNTQNAFMGTDITLHPGTVVYGVAQDGGDVPDYVYVVTYAHLLDLDDATVGAQPTENDGGSAGNSFRPESHLTGDTNANFMYGVTSGSTPELLISRIRGTTTTPTYVDLYVFGGQGTSTGTSGSTAGDDAYDWATEGNDDPIPLAKLSNAPAGDITAITTPTASGIALSGCGSGSCEVSLNVDGMDALGQAALDANDDVIVADGATEYKVTLRNLATWTLDRIDNLPDLTDAIANDDEFVLNDRSDADAPKDVQAQALANYIGARLAGDNLTFNTTTNQLDAEAGSEPAEVLYDNTSGTALTRAAGAWTWADDLKFPLSRALTAADDGGLIEIEVTFTATRTTPTPSVDITRSFSIDISPRQFRVLPPNDLTTGTALTANFIHAFGIRAREGDPTFGTAARNSIVTRQRHSDGHDILRFIMNTDSDTVALSDVRARVVLIAGGRTGSTATAGILQQKYVASNSTNSTLTDGTWTTLMSQSITLAAANDRVFVDATVPFQFDNSEDAECDLRVVRGSTLVGSVSGGGVMPETDIAPVSIKAIDDSPGAGTYTYAVQAQDADTGVDSGTCEINPQGMSSFAQFEALAANP